MAQRLAAANYEPIVLTRSPRADAAHRQVQWNGKNLGPWADLLDGAEAVVNLAGKSVNCIYTPENRREIIDSRLDSVRVLGEAINRCQNPPRALVQAASLAIYGNSGDRVCAEDAPPGDGFPVETCLLWEKAIDALQTPRTRKVVLRIGFALGPGGGALEPLVKLTRLFLGGTVGNGKQYISWLHLDDLNEMFLWGIEREDFEGVYNATGPNPVTNSAFMRSLRRVLHRPWSPPTPSLAVKIGARLFMRTESSLALHGRRCTPRRFIEKGFQFKHPHLSESLEAILCAREANRGQSFY